MKESVAGIFSNLWKSVKSGVSGAMNSVIARIESAINSLIRGVNKVQKRIKLLCGKEYGLHYTENADGGLTAHL